MSKIAYVTSLTAAAAIVAGSLAASPAVAQDVTWNFNLFGPKRAATAGIEAVAAFYEKASGGKFKITLNYGSALGPERQAPEAIKSGGYEGGLLCIGYYPNKFPLLTVLELPFLPPRDLKSSSQVEAAVLAHPEIKKEMESRWSMMSFAPAFLPAYEFMGNKKITSTADMKGVKMRISGLNAKALSVFGAVPTMVTAPEGYTALERGTIDTMGLPYSYTFGAYKLYEVSKYVTEGMGMNGLVCTVGASSKAFNALPKEWQDLLPQAMAAGAEALHAAYAAADAKWIPLFHEKLEVNKFPVEEREKLAAGANSIWEDWVAEQEENGRPGRAMLDFVKAEVAKHK